MNAEVLRSTETFAEIAEVIMRKKFDPYLAIAQRELFLASFYDNSTHVLISERIDACRDAKDNKFLELAVCGKAEYILTGDKDLLALTPYRATHIVNPSQLSTRLYANS